MIVTEIYNGQGLGNQLWCYVVTRVIAKDKNYDFGIKSPEKFKCNDFMNIDFGKKVIGGYSLYEGGKPIRLPEGIKHYYNEKKILHPINGVDIRIYDEKLINIRDNTKIDGIMQVEKYIAHRKEEIREWLRVKKEYECYDFSDDNICIINFRGGEYISIPNVFLPKKYWDDAMINMRKINKNLRFVVITDDVITAKKFFPNLDVLHFSISKDYVIIKNAHYLILSNSSFAFFPAWLNENLKACISPKYWSQYNTSDGFGGCGYNIIKGWMYQNRDGKLEDYNSCTKELEEYIENHRDYYNPSFITKIKRKIMEKLNKIYSKILTKVAPPKNKRKYLKTYDSIIRRFSNIHREFEKKCLIKSDIHEHLTTLRDLSIECEHITEMGVRDIVSTWSFLEGLRVGKKGTLISIDINEPNPSETSLKHVERLAKKEGMNFKFIKDDTLKMKIDETDLLFIDTLHQYSQLKKELNLHAPKARKYIVFHDTESFGKKGDDGGEGLWRAIQEFLNSNKNWKIKERYTNNNGLTILERII